MKKCSSFPHNKRHKLTLQLETIFPLFDNTWAVRKWAVSYTAGESKSGIISVTAMWQYPSKNAQTFDPAIQLPRNLSYRYTCTCVQ